MRRRASCHSRRAERAIGNPEDGEFAPGFRFPGNDNGGRSCIPPVASHPVGMSKTYYVYMLASRRNGTLYLGVTNDLSRRVYEHKIKSVKGFTSRYGVHMLVWYELYEDINEAIGREKQLKKWERAWKLKLIEDINPSWRDLYFDLNA
jgi:putative endonuclease